MTSEMKRRAQDVVAPGGSSDLTESDKGSSQRSSGSTPPAESVYFGHDRILQYVLRQLAAK